MKNKVVELLTRVGPKGQIVLRKELRKAAGIKEGDIVRTRLVDKKILIEAIDWEEEIRRIRRIAERISKKWPKGLSSVEVMKEERR